MAKSTRAGARGTARASAKSRKVVTTDVDVVEDTGGIGIDAGLAILTAVILVAAIVMVDMLQAKSGDGLIF